jgi:hypothetical protein
MFLFPGARPFHVWPRLIFTHNNAGKMKSTLHDTASVDHLEWAITTVEHARQWLPVPPGAKAKDTTRLHICNVVGGAVMKRW